MSPVCTHHGHAKGSPDTPTGHASKLAPVTVSSSGSARDLADILRKPVSIRKLGTFWLSEAKGMRHVGGQSGGQSEVNSEVNLEVNSEVNPEVNSEVNSSQF